MAITHGGNLLAIAEQYNSCESEWIDLSTGVSPFIYPIGDVPESCWNRLPEHQDGLEAEAMRYYRASEAPIALAGSQAAIMTIPTIITKQLGRCGVITLPAVGYKEHQHAWQGFSENGESWVIDFYQDYPTEQQIARADVVLIINPNNPTGVMKDRETLVSLQKEMRNKSGFLIVDEAFADAGDDVSLLEPNIELANTVILRSVGKFFGLAGARVGFLFSEHQIKALMEEKLGPWTVSGPSRWVVKQALSDRLWQQKTRLKIKESSRQLNQLLKRYLISEQSGTDLFTTVYLHNAESIYRRLCQQKVLTRLCDEKNAIRFGLPATPQQWLHLENALKALQK